MSLELEQWATTNVRQKATVDRRVRGSRSNERLMLEPREREHDSLAASDVSCILQNEQKCDGLDVS